MNITPHITLDNLIYHPTATRLKIPNIPPDDIIPNLVSLCSDVLEPIYTLLHGNMAILSGYRSPRLQAALVHMGKKAAHTEGKGADFTTPGMDLSQAFDEIAASDIPFDTLTWAHNRFGNNWIEVTISDEPRRICKRNVRQSDRAVLA